MSQLLRRARRGETGTSSATAATTASATASSQVSSQASPSGPCSACSSTSMAACSVGVEPSATTTTSDGPANADGTPTSPWPATSRLARATMALPGPTITSTGLIDSVP